jgi:hypothetical protein
VFLDKKRACFQKLAAIHQAIDYHNPEWEVNLYNSKNLKSCQEWDEYVHQLALIILNTLVPKYCKTIEKFKQNFNCLFIIRNLRLK